MNNEELKKRIEEIVGNRPAWAVVERITEFIQENFVPKDSILESRHVKEYIEFLKSYPDFEKYPVKDISIDFCDSL